MENVPPTNLPSRMDNESSTTSPNTKRVMVLLALAALINYIDRGNLSIAASLLKDELNLSASQLGILLSSFFWTYSFFLPVSGWLADRFDAKWVMAIGFLIWSGATAVTGGLHAFSALLAARLMLGIGESAAYPCYARTLVRHVPEVGRGFANALIAAGVGCGPALGTFFGGTLKARYGWRPFFVVLGLISMAWLIPWFRWIPRCGTAISHLEKGFAGFRELLKLRSMWGTCGGLFGANYVLYFEITWLPYYLWCASATSRWAPWRELAGWDICATQLPQSSSVGSPTAGSPLVEHPPWFAKRLPAWVRGAPGCSSWAAPSPARQFQ